MFKLLYFKEHEGKVGIEFTSQIKASNPVYRLLAVDPNIQGELFPTTKMPGEFESWESQLEAVKGTGKFSNIGRFLILDIQFGTELGRFASDRHSEKDAICTAEWLNYLMKKGSN